MTDQPRRCDARIKGLVKMPDGSTRSRHTHCRRWATKGSTKCRLHGSASTGPKSAEGMANTLAAMREGRKRYDEKLRAAGVKPPWARNGFKKGWRRLKREEETKRAEVARMEALPPIEKKRLSALDAIAAMRQNLRRNMMEVNR